MHLLTLTGPPETPTDLHVISSTSSSVTLRWRKGFNGGHPQIFVVTYKQHETNEYQKLESNETTDIHYTSVINNLESGKIYTIFLFAYNIEGASQENITLHNVFVEGN